MTDLSAFSRLVRGEHGLVTVSTLRPAQTIQSTVVNAGVLDHPLPGFDPAGLPALLREIFTAAGGTHDDWDTYDQVMATDRRAAVLLSPDRVYSNPAR